MKRPKKPKRSPEHRAILSLIRAHRHLVDEIGELRKIVLEERAARLDAAKRASMAVDWVMKHGGRPAWSIPGGDAFNRHLRKKLDDDLLKFSDSSPTDSIDSPQPPLE